MAIVTAVAPVRPHHARSAARFGHNEAFASSIKPLASISPAIAAAKYAKDGGHVCRRQPRSKKAGASILKKRSASSEAVR